MHTTRHDTHNTRESHSAANASTGVEGGGGDVEEEEEGRGRKRDSKQKQNDLYELHAADAHTGRYKYIYIRVHATTQHIQ